MVTSVFQPKVDRGIGPLEVGNLFGPAREESPPGKRCRAEIVLRQDWGRSRAATYKTDQHHGIGAGDRIQSCRRRSRLRSNHRGRATGDSRILAAASMVPPATGRGIGACYAWRRNRKNFRIASWLDMPDPRVGDIEEPERALASPGGFRKIETGVRLPGDQGYAFASTRRDPSGERPMGYGLTKGVWI